ncbi:MAG: SDR family oxidoreductase [Paracoccaceae bacterium]
MKVLILGGYGVFGGRLAELLSDLEQVELLICGRDLSRATQFCKSFDGPATTRPFRLVRKDIARALAVEQPDLVVDASGPFQDYGDDRYNVIRACIASGTDYLDFADAAGFVFDVPQFDAEARAAGIFVLSGVSSFPVLTAAVLREISRSMDITSVIGGIAPSPYAGIGLNVMRAVLGYAGTPVKLRRDGVDTHAIGLVEHMRFSIAVPGHLPLQNKRFSLVEVPDLQVIPPKYKGLRDIWMGAGPVPEFLHRFLNGLAIARARFGLPSLKPLAGLAHRVLNLMRFGEHRGGMFIRARGLRDGKEVEQSWHLIAEGDDGPYIPSMAIEALIRKLVAGIRPANGARAATDALDLSDYAQLFERRDIHTGFRLHQENTAPIYRRVLGPAFDKLPLQVQHLHDATDTRRWAGTAQVRRGNGVLAGLIAKLLGFPEAADAVPVTVTLTPQQDGELWERDFGGKRFSSFQSCGAGKNDYLLIERFGRISVALALVTEGDKLYLLPRRWSFMGIPLPAALLPRGQTFETEREGRFCFDVEIAAPLVGLIVAYRGRLSACG